MVGIGTILASAGGVFITSASNITISLNNISESARWGIAVRSNGKAQSYNNTIDRNWIKRTGLRTADFGAISFIDHGAGHGNTTGNRVIGNCVRETKGMRDSFTETGELGKIYNNYFGRALYLDDHTSNVEITGNIFVDTSANAIFFHSGNYNTAQNNVFVNATVLAAKTGGQLLFKEITHGHIYPQVGNVLERNVVWSPRAADEEGHEVPLYEGRAQAVGGKRGKVEANLYYRPGLPMKGDSLFFGKSWAHWKKEGHDTHGLLNADPGFIDARGGDFNLRGDSPLPALGFLPLPMPLCPRAVDVGEP
jgi:parallel beta-helix repeat protein